MSKPGTQRTKREVTRQTILQAAQEIFTRDGFSNSKTSDIARLAGVAEGTVYLHFESKQGLFAATTNKTYDQMIIEARTILEQPLDKLTLLKQLTRYHLLTLERDWRNAVSVLGPGVLNSEDDYYQAFYQRNREYRSLFTKLIQSLIDEGTFGNALPAKMLRDTLFGSIEYFAMANFDSGRDYSIDTHLEQLWLLVLNGAKTPQAQPSIDEKLNRIQASIDALTQHGAPNE